VELFVAGNNNNNNNNNNSISSSRWSAGEFPVGVHDPFQGHGILTPHSS